MSEIVTKLNKELMVEDFKVPDNVLLYYTAKNKNGVIEYNGGISIQLNMLDGQTLNALCKKFRKEVFEKAKISDTF